MKKSKVITLTKLTLEDCPESLRQFWHGEVFYKHPKQGVLDVLAMCKLLKFKYMSTADNQLVGDFCLVGI